MSDAYSFDVTAQGAQPTPPATLLTQLIAGGLASNPGYTANLPASLVEDISSTDVGALVVMDTAAVETINSISPFTANPFILSELGQVYIGPGSAPAVPTNTSVYVVFTATDTATSAELPGYPIPVGFTVSDGTYQYVVQDGGVTASSGVSQPLFCQATIPGSWAVPTNTVTNLITQPPSEVTLTCANPTVGTSGAVAETEEQYRARVVQAGMAVGTGIPTLLKTLLGNVLGVQQRLISVLQQAGGFWEVIVGGGDPYEVAYAIYESGINIAGLVGSTLAVTNITQAHPGVVTTDLNHGFTTGQNNVNIAQVVGMVPINSDGPYTVTVITEKTFSIGVDTTGFPAYVSGGVVTPNLRNVTPNIYDYPDIYTVPFVNPPQQTVTMTVSWNTTAANFTSQAAVSQAAAPAIAAYVNSITGGAPLNIGVMNSVFQTAVANILAPGQISVLTFVVSINGIVTSPEAGTQLVFGDPESFFEATTAGIVVAQG